MLCVRAVDYKALAADYEAMRAALEEELYRVRQDRDTHFGEMMRLQAECDELKRALAESQANDRRAMAYLNDVRAIVGGDDFPDMIKRVGNLCEMRIAGEQYPRRETK